MALIEWDDSLSVGVQEIDAQHTELVKILNQLNDTMVHGQDPVRVQALLGSLVSHTREHFAAEEAMMAMAGYPHLEEHRQQHCELIRKVETCLARFERGETGLSLHLMNFLRDWLKIHILVQDKAYGSSLNGHSVD